jgi:hypothetical protein
VSGPSTPNTPNTPLQQPVAVFREMIDEIVAISTEAADSDEAGTWGMDGWIKLIHNLLDLQVRLAATVLQTSIAGPWWLAEPSRACPPSEDIKVPNQKPYPRRLTVVKSFERQGRKGSIVPDSEIRFDPEILMPGDRVFRVALADNRFVGANYTGDIGLCDASTGASATPEKVLKTITVGL